MTGRTHATKPTPKVRQLTFNSRGGPRVGAGRKRKSAEPRVPHAAREHVSRHHPVHVTVRLNAGLPSLRRPSELDVLKTAFSRSNDRVAHHGLRVVHFAALSNHVHLLVEVEDERSLSRGMQGLLVRIARNLNRIWKRRDSVFADRYHARALRSPREVRNALVYVLLNGRKHGCHLAGIDPFTSGRELDGWKQAFEEDDEASATLRPRTWLLAVGWKRGGLLDVEARPGGVGRARSGSAALVDIATLHRAARRPRG